jgi:long-subunit fatty acid transport protein
MKLASISFAMVTVWLVGIPAAVHASDFLVPGSRGTAMAGALVANSEDGHATWYNPALLARTDDCHFGLQYTGIFPSLTANVHNYGSLGLVPHFQGFDKQGALNRTQTQLRVNDMFSGQADPDAFHGFNITLLLPITKMMPKFPYRIGFGLSILVPGAGTSVVRVAGHTADQPFYPVFGSRIQRLRLYAGAGFEILKDKLSIGVGATVFTNIQGEVGTLTPMTTFDYTHPKEKQDLPAPSKATFAQDLGTTASPIFGIQFRPIKGLDFGAYYRMAQSMDLNFNVAAGVDVRMGYKLAAEMPYYLKSDFFYIPASTGLGAGVSLIPGLLLTAQVDWVFWSGLTDNINIADFDIVPGNINDKGGLVPLEEYGDFKARSYPVPGIRARDVFSPKAGLEWTWWGFTYLRAGYAFTPSALEPDQQYMNMLLDNNYHTISGGVGFSLKDPLQFIEKPILLDFHFAANVLEKRYNRVGLNDLDGGFHAKGVVETGGTFFGLGVELTLQL